MEKNMDEMLLTVNSLCPEEKPEILDFSDLYKDTPIPNDRLYEMLSLLSSKGFIRLVYFDENEKEACVKVLPLGRAEAKSITELQVQAEKKRLEEERLKKEALEKALAVQEKLAKESCSVSNEKENVQDEKCPKNARNVNKNKTDEKALTKAETASVQKAQNGGVSVDIVPAVQNADGGLVLLKRKELKKEIGYIAFICSLSGSVIGGLIAALLYLLVK